MFNLFKKRPGVTLVMIIAGMYIVVIAGWAGFIIIAKSRKTTQLTPAEATQLHKECVARKAEEQQ